MSSLATEVIAVRAAFGWSIGLLAMIAISAYTARPWRVGRVSSWIIVPVLVARGLLLLGLAGLSIIVGRASGQLSYVAAAALIAAVVIASLWISLILVQVGQNLAYRLVGAPVQPIRWWAADTGGNRRRVRRRASN